MKKSGFKGTTSLPEVFLELLKPIFVDLSNEELLKRCILGTTKTQMKVLIVLCGYVVPNINFMAPKLSSMLQLLLFWHSVGVPQDQLDSWKN